MLPLVMHNVLRSLVVLAIVAGQTVSAQPAVTISPSAPTDEDEIAVTIDFTMQIFCAVGANTVVSGNTIRTTIVVGACEPVPFDLPYHISTQFGPLPPGTYTYEVYFQFVGFPPGTLWFQRSLIVAAAAGANVPTLHASALAALAMVLAVLGMIVLRQRDLLYP